MGFSRVLLAFVVPDFSSTAPTHGPAWRGSRSRLASLGLALLAVLSLAPSAHAEPLHTVTVPVVDGWRYRWGDSPPGADGVPTWARGTGAEEGWQPMTALQEPPGRGQHTFLWLSLPVPQGTWAEPTLYLGSVAGAFEVYAGGQRVHVSGKVNPAGREDVESMSWHIVPLPPAAVGQRVLLRVQGSGPGIGVSRDARVGPRHELHTALSRAGVASFVMGTLLLVIALVSAAAALLRRQQRMLVPLTVFATGSGLLLLGTSGLFLSLWDSTEAGTYLTMFGSYGILPGLAWFISDTIGEGRMRWFRRGAAVVSVPAALQAVLLFVDRGMAVGLLTPLTLYVMPSLLVCAGVVVVEALRGDPDARIFAAGLGLLLVFFVLAILPMFGLAKEGENQMHWGFLALTLSLVAIVGRRSTLIVQSLARHTRQLEERRGEVRQLAESMGNGAGELATVAQQLRTSAEDQSSGISRQATALQQLEHTVEEIRQSSHVTAEKARLLAASAETAEQVGRDGGVALERTLTDLAAIRAEVSEMANRILSLDSRTREISGIVDAVKTLADQSNMLAINAAIEAVRSGDAGKGFGVVAREMRGLADQSIQATHRIREVLDGLSTSMRETAKLSEQGEQRVRGSLDAVRASGAQLQQLAGIISDTSTNVRQITAAVAQQDAGTHQIAQAIQELSSQMQRTLKVVEETRTVTHSVQSLAGSMAGMADTALRSGTLDAQAVPAR